MTEDEMYDIIRGYEESERDYHECNIELEAENAKLRELMRETLMDPIEYARKYDLPEYDWIAVNAHLDMRMCDLGIEV